MDDCMTMPGGGVHEVAPGQITDDSELMMCLLWGYVDSNKDDSQPRVFDLDALAIRCAMWVNSDPFDIGNTTENALLPLKNDPKYTLAFHAANEKNPSSKSNGSLMRCMPHAIFLADLAKAEKYKEMYDLISMEVNITHGQKMVHEAIFVYIVALCHILNNPDAPDRGKVAFEKAYALAKSDFCTTIDEKYGEKVEWWMDYAKGWVDAAIAAKQGGMKAPYLTQMDDPEQVKKMNANTMQIGPMLIDIKKQ